MGSNKTLCDFFSASIMHVDTQAVTIDKEVPYFAL